MDFICILAALLFFVGNLLKLIFFGKEFGREMDPTFDWTEYKQLYPEKILEEWNLRIQHKSHLMAACTITSLGWFFLCFPILQLVYVLNSKYAGAPGSSRNLWLHTGIVILTLGGAFTEWIANFLSMGSTLACQMMITSFNLQTWTDIENDNIGLRSLEVAFFAIRGMKIWVDAFEWIALSFIMVFTFLAVQRYQKAHSNNPYKYFSRIWNALGLFIGFLSLLDFITEILRIVNFNVFSRIAFVYGTMNRLVFLPVWLLLLGWNLPYALIDLESKKHTNKNDDDTGSIDDCTGKTLTADEAEDPAIFEGVNA